MWRHYWLLACGLMLGLALASSAALAAQAEGRPMLGLPTHGLRAKEVPADKLVFTRQSDWTDFWAKYGTGPAPLVDFTQWQIVGVFLGERPNPGYGIDITGYTTSGTTIEVQYTEWKPAPGMVYAQVIVHPYDVVAIPAAGRVSFKGTTKQREAAMAAAPAEFQVIPAPAPSSAAPDQYVLISDEPAWIALWAQRFPEGAPSVDFSRHAVAGVFTSAEAPPFRAPHVSRIGDRVRVILAAAGQQAAGVPQAFLVAVPRAARVDIVATPRAMMPGGEESRGRGVEESEGNGLNHR